MLAPASCLVLDSAVRQSCQSQPEVELPKAPKQSNHSLPLLPQTSKTCCNTSQPHTRFTQRAREGHRVECRGKRGQDTSSAPQTRPSSPHLVPVSTGRWYATATSRKLSLFKCTLLPWNLWAFTMVRQDYDLDRPFHALPFLFSLSLKVIQPAIQVKTVSKKGFLEYKITCDFHQQSPV